jgi:hypothetical protein
MKLVYSLILLLAVFSISCRQEKPYQLTVSKEPRVISEGKVIDVTAILEEYGGKKIAEFEGGSWAVAVRSLKSGYTYYYDSSNNFLGRSKD